jgi:hypothetical protein
MEIYYGVHGNEGTYVRLLPGRVNVAKDMVNGAGLILYYGPYDSSIGGIAHTYGAGKVYAFELVPGRMVSWPRAHTVFNNVMSATMVAEIYANWDAITKDHVYPTETDEVPIGAIPVPMVISPPRVSFEMFDAEWPAMRSHP